MNSPLTDSQLHNQTINDLWENQVQKTPNTIAVTFTEHSLTYQILNRKVNQLAHYLQSLGIGTQTPIGLCIPRSHLALMGLLAILKIGGIYVPIDPLDAPDRLSFILEDAQISVVITLQSFIGKLATKNLQIVCLDPQWDNIQKYSSENLNTLIKSEQLAYIIYTSGTTGQPKGVMADHSNLLNYISATQQRFQFHAEDIMTCIDRLVFGISLFELLTPLIAGAKVVILSREQVLNTYELTKNLAEVTSFHAVPSLMQIVVDFIREKNLQEQYNNIQRVFVGGDRIPPQLLETMKEVFANAQIYVLYGCSEVSSLCSNYAVPRNIPVDRVFIGQPFANMELRLYNEEQTSVTPGVKGEIYVGGKSVTRGYWQRQELTEKKYVEIEGQRFYKTGDLGRYVEGNIEFFGRSDYQVKIRGIRIELGEIEANLEKHPSIKLGVVIVKQDKSSENYLVAYIVKEVNQTITIREMRDFLQQKLPEHMIPRELIFLEDLPLNSNGKVDRNALVELDENKNQLDRLYTAPRDGLEVFLTELWQEVLEIDKIGVDDSFFELGGDSLKATLLINKLQEALGEFIYVVSLLESPSIKEFSLHLQENYLDSVKQFLGEKEEKIAVGSNSKIDKNKIEQFRQLIPPPPRRFQPETSKNPPMVFILSPPRSGTTLLRTILGGHPRIFAPPELSLIEFNTLAERKNYLSRQQYVWLEGTIRAIMEINDCSAEQAQKMMEDLEKQQLTTQQFYGVLQEWIGERMLVDKVPYYPQNQEVLRSIEGSFREPLYLHVVRHPYGMIRSFEKMKADLVLWKYNKIASPFSSRELAEMVWISNHQNILNFLQDIPPHRQFRVHFEDLVRQPRITVTSICQWMQLNFYPEMIDIQTNRQQRMTDGLHPGSPMLGDVKINQYQKIESEVADRWKQDNPEDNLGEITWELAQTFGYERSQTDDREEIVF